MLLKESTAGPRSLLLSSLDLLSGFQRPSGLTSPLRFSPRRVRRGFDSLSAAASAVKRAFAPSASASCVPRPRSGAVAPSLLPVEGARLLHRRRVSCQPSALEPYFLLASDSRCAPELPEPVARGAASTAASRLSSTTSSPPSLPAAPASVTRPRRAQTSTRCDQDLGAAGRSSLVCLPEAAPPPPTPSSARLLLRIPPRHRLRGRGWQIGQPAESAPVTRGSRTDSREGRPRIGLSRE